MVGGEPPPGRDGDLDDPAFAGLLEESAEDLYESAPCGYLSTMLDGRIVKANATLLGWLGRGREEVVGRLHFSDLLTVGGRIYHETHFAPLLAMHGEVNGIALDLVTASGDRLPVLVTSVVRRGPTGAPRVVRTTVFDARERRAYERELLRARRQAEQERDRIEQLATTLQRTLLPPSLPTVPGIEVAAHYHHASPDQVGGDFYDLFPLGDGRWGFFLGDVCGKGSVAAAVTSLTRYTLRAAAVTDPGPEAVLRTLNTVLGQEVVDGVPRFCTVVFGVLEPADEQCRVTFAGGGHTPPAVLRADGTAAYHPTTGGQLVGVLPDARFVTRHLTLAPGDTFLLYTDGLTEARTADGPDTRFEEEGLLEFLHQAPPAAAELVSALAARLAAFGDGLEDDVALLALGLPGSGDRP
ncbi:SpoIIE family protein phosphatase [Saccharothrix sp.]|uniref:PP2C family protein-serine/threonine phosphatase n=1 Tax=Saccharothrix sp. TaxID=1873460 RepID=UPI002810D67A|nr:SpoIIE family protein phosphatase [Saccharothrix sp.]